MSEWEVQAIKYAERAGRVQANSFVLTAITTSPTVLASSSGC